MQKCPAIGTSIYVGTLGNQQFDLLDVAGSDRPEQCRGTPFRSMLVKKRDDFGVSCLFGRV